MTINEQNVLLALEDAGMETEMRGIFMKYYRSEQ